jgi:hypothetical protein
MALRDKIERIANQVYGAGARRVLEGARRQARPLRGARLRTASRSAMARRREYSLSRTTPLSRGADRVHCSRSSTSAASRVCRLRLPARRGDPDDAGPRTQPRVGQRIDIDERGRDRRLF